MDIRKLQRTIVDGLEDVKAQHIAVFNTEHLSALFERVIIASGTSNRQTKALASSVREAVKDAGYPIPRTEGEANGEWIIIDCGAAVVHVMQPMIREYYHLEEIWGDKPVHMKFGAAKKLVKASEAAEPPAPTSAGRSPVLRKRPKAATAATKKPTASPTARKTSPPATKKPSASAVAKRTSAAPVTRVTGVKGASAAKKIAPGRAATTSLRTSASRAGTAVKRPAGKKTVERG